MDDRIDSDQGRHRLRMVAWLRILLTVLLLATLAVLFLSPGAGRSGGVVWLWVAVLASLGLVWAFLGRSRVTAGRAPEIQPQPIYETEQPEPVKEVMDVRVAVEDAGVQIFRGRLRESAAAAYQKLKHALGAQTVPLLQQDRQMGAAIVLMPKRVEEAVLEKPVFPWLNWLLFVLTVLTTTWVGAANEGVDLLREPGRFAVGLPYSIGLLAILGVHELGHFFAARHHGMNVTPPYFIPVPFALGTFGAFIKMRSPSEDRRSLFDVAAAGPLAGLAIAIPALLIGLRSSHVESGPVGGMPLEPSILFGLLAKISLGPALADGSILRLSPLAFAGWLGLFITALNLLPIGQLDGGHIARAMFGNRVGGIISRVAMWGLFLRALFVPSLIMWAIIVFFIAGHATPPLNDLTPISRARQCVGVFTFIMLALLVPMPVSWRG
jgi:Zn-dependent protease